MFDGFKVAAGETSAEEALMALLTWQHHLYPHCIGLGSGCRLPQRQGVPPPDLHLTLVRPLIGSCGIVDAQPEGGVSLHQLEVWLKMWLRCTPGHGATRKDLDQVVVVVGGRAGLEEPPHGHRHLLQGVVGIHFADEFKTLTVSDSGNSASQCGVQTKTCSGGESPWCRDRHPAPCCLAATLHRQHRPHSPMAASSPAAPVQVAWWSSSPTQSLALSYLTPRSPNPPGSPEYPLSSSIPSPTQWQGARDPLLMLLPHRCFQAPGSAIRRENHPKSQPKAASP